jgi:hypothetical protein
MPVRILLGERLRLLPLLTFLRRDVAALITHARREIAARSDSVEDWLATALKTAAGALARMEAT